MPRQHLKRILSLACALLPVCAAAQPGPPQGRYAAAAFTYTGGELCQSVKRVYGETPLGRRAGIALSAAASSARIDSCAYGYFPGTLYKDDLRLTARRPTTRSALIRSGWC